MHILNFESHIPSKPMRAFRSVSARTRLAGIATCVGLLATAGCQSTPASQDTEANTFRTDEPSAPAETAAPNPERTPAEGFYYRAVKVDDRWIAITFDDGPDPEQTPLLLDILNERSIRATFFVVGRNVTDNRHLLERMVAEGHEIGNHSWDHPYLDAIDTDSVDEQLERTSSAIQTVTGLVPTLMRPPYGATNPTLNQRINVEHGMKVILWSIDSFDWRPSNPERIQQAILSEAHPGGIILAHDTQTATIEAMPDTLDTLTARGYRFVTVSELIELGRQASAPPE